MDALQDLPYLNAFLLAVGAWVLLNLLFGVAKDVFTADPGDIFEQWAEKYGLVYQIPAPFGERRTVLMDPRAVAYFYSRDTFTYHKSTFTKQMTERLVGKGLLFAEGDAHQRQRSSLNSAFVNTAIRTVTPVFFDSAYKVKAAWDMLISASDSGEAVIDVQKWMNRVTLDSIGIAGFGHDFGALHGRYSPIREIFDTLNDTPSWRTMMITELLGPALPFLMKFPSRRNRLVDKLQEISQAAAKGLIERGRMEKGQSMATSSSRSIIGSLLKAENANSPKTLTEDEVIAQVRLFLVAGYETTAVTLTWALYELARRADAQDRLRAELSGFSNMNLSYDQLHDYTLHIPYLDAVTREVIRLHPAVELTTRTAVRDDAIPLSNPIITASGERVESIMVARGTSIHIPIRAINRSEQIWGPDAKEFKPERWLNYEAGVTGKAKSVQGYHHILSFADGPRTCLGLPFAIAELKSVLSVLIRNYVFDLRDGPDTKIDIVKRIIRRPKVVGETCTSLPLRIRRFEK